jgi:hypothetical protein
MHDLINEFYWRQMFNLSQDETYQAIKTTLRPIPSIDRMVALLYYSSPIESISDFLF